MLTTTRQGEMLILSADPPERVRFKHPATAQFIPDRGGRVVGGGADSWHIKSPASTPLRFSRLNGSEWVDAGMG